jgi:hypothetical protein
MEEHLLTTGINTLIFYPEINSSKFAEFIFERLSEWISTAQLEKFGWLLEQILGHKKMVDFGFSAVLSSINKKVTASNLHSVLERANQIIAASPNRQAVVAEILNRHSKDKEFVQLKVSKNPASKLLLNYLITDGQKLMDSLIKEYTILLSNKLRSIPTREINSHLVELFWKCILNYGAHQGKSDSLKRSFKTAVLYQFPIPNISGWKNLHPKKHQKNNEQNFSLKGGGQVTLSELILLIEECLKNGSGDVIRGEFKHSLSDLITLCLELKPTELRKILTNTSISEQRIEVLKSSVSFHHFSLWIASDVGGVLNEAMDAMRSLYEVVMNIGSAEVAERMLNDYWKISWHLIKTNRWSAESLQKLIQDTFHYFTQTAGFKMDNVVAELKKKRLRLPKDLRTHLIAQFPVFSAIQLGNEPNESLVGCDRKGLLENLCFDLLKQKGIPVWFNQHDEGFKSNELQDCKVIDGAIERQNAQEAAELPEKNQFTENIIRYSSSAENWKGVEADITRQLSHSTGADSLTEVPITQDSPAQNDSDLETGINKKESSLSIKKNSTAEVSFSAKASSSSDTVKNDSLLTSSSETAIVDVNDVCSASQPNSSISYGSESETDKSLNALFTFKTEYSQNAVRELLHEIIQYYPMKLLIALKQETLSDSQILWLNKRVNVRELFRSIGNLNKNKQTLLAILEGFYFSLGQISLRNISGKELRDLLFKKVIKAWTNNNWSIISTENIWNELIWDTCVVRGISKEDLIMDLGKMKFYFPPSLQVSLSHLSDQIKAKILSQDEAIVSKLKHQIKLKTLIPSAVQGGISVRNAGIVLINSYLSILFERLGLTADRKFLSDAYQAEAVHYLQYVVTGLSSTEESLLPLNKVLCGLPLEQPVYDGITISDDYKKIIDGLIKAAISHWPSIGNSSIDGFRGNWLVRDGLLVEHEDKWELTVEKRAYDLLIYKSPFSFSIIKYPWMDKPLQVNWPY